MKGGIISSPATAPDVVGGDDSNCPHLLWAMWPEDEYGGDAHIGFWRTGNDDLVIKAFESNRDIRGQAMLDWLAGYGMPVRVVEVVHEAVGFWDLMLERGRIADWEIADGMPSPLERRSVAFREAMST